MNELANFLVESILLEADSINKVIVVYSGRFQPFHKGHYATYQNLCKKFGSDNVYIATSNVTDNNKSPFDFKDKKAIMTKMFGIPSNKIVQVKNPYAPNEVLDKYKPETTAVVSAVGEKDEMRLGGKYFRPYKDGKIDTGYRDAGYVYASPALSNPISGTDVRNWLSKGSEAEKKKNFMKAYPKFDEQIFKLITLKLSKFAKEGIYESIKITELNDSYAYKTLNEMGFPGGVGVGLSLPSGFINGAPTAKETNKLSKKLKNKGLSGYEEVDEDINVDVDNGDIVLMGKFKNKKVVVKDIGKDEHGMPTINGKKAVTFRVPEDVNETIKKVGDNEWAVYPKNGGDRLGTHKSYASALRQLKAIEIHKYEGVEDRIPGGLAKGKTLIDLAKKWDSKGYYEPKQFAAKYIKPQLMKGIKVEMEHTTDVRIATEIAMDHLWEDLHYYEKLAVIETENTLFEYSGNGAFYNDGNAVTGYQWNPNWDDYDNAKYYLNNLPGWTTKDKIPSERVKKGAIDKKLAVNNHDDSIHKYNRILKYGFQKPEEFLEKNKNPKSKNKDIEGTTDAYPNKWNNDVYTDERININENSILKDLEKQRMKLFIQALKMMPNSPAQMKVRYEIDKLGKEIEKLQKENINESLLTEGGAYVICNECGERMKQIQYRHLMYKHNMTMNEYKEKHPNSKLVCEDVKNVGDKNPMKTDIVKLKHKNSVNTIEYKGKISKALLGKNTGNVRSDVSERNKTLENKLKVSNTLKETYKNNKYLRDSKSIIGKQFGFGNKQLIEQLYNKLGWTRPEDREPFTLYKEIVCRNSNKNYKKYFNEIPNAKNRSREYHLDHKYSIKEAFDNNIPIEVVSHYKNLEIIDGRLNESKGKNSSILLEELLKQIEYSIRPLNTKILLQCGGAYGHMHHPFDIEMNLTFGDLKNIVTKALTGDLETVREKCISGDSIISTENNGDIAIANFVDKKIEDKVLSYNEETSKNEYMDVIASFNNDETDEWLEIELEDGKIIQVTPNHRIFVEGIGYVEAKDLTEDMELKIL